MNQTHDANHFDYFLKTILISLIGWAMFVVTDTLNKWVVQDFKISFVIFTFSFFSALLTGFYIFFRYGFNGFRTERYKWHFIRAVCICASTLLCICALKLIPLADFYGIIFLSPLLLCLMSHFFLKERIGRHRMTAIIVGFMGVLVLAGPQFNEGNIGFLFALSAVFFSASNGISVRKIGREKNMILFAFYPSLFNMIVFLPFVLMDAPASMPPLDGLFLIFLIAPASIAGLVLHSLAFARAPETSMIAPFHYSQMIWGVMIGYFLFDEIPGFQTILGASIIIGAGLYMIWREHKLHKAAVIRNLQR